MKIQKLFGKERVCGIAGNKSEGKTNNIIALIKDFREHNEETEIIVFGMSKLTIDWLKENYQNISEFSSLNQLTKKKDCLIIIDEFQKLKLNDRRHKTTLDDLIDFIYHKNNWLIFSSANLREFNSIIGGKIERWGLKSLSIKNLVNGSQLKNIVMDYCGRYKSINNIELGKDKILVINEKEEVCLELEYIPEIDEKKDLKSIFKNVKKLSEKKSENCREIKK